MRRPVAIVMLLVFLINVGGSYGILLRLKALSSSQTAGRLSSNMYELGATVTFKVPFKMPYGTNFDNYIPGSVEYERDGEIYLVMKQRVHNDTLYVACIKDVQTTSINSELHATAKSFSGHSDDNEQKNVAPNLIKDYMVSTIDLQSSVSGWEQQYTPSIYSHSFINVELATASQPPEMLSGGDVVKL